MRAPNSTMNVPSTRPRGPRKTRDGGSGVRGELPEGLVHQHLGDRDLGGATVADRHPDETGLEGHPLELELLEGVGGNGGGTDQRLLLNEEQGHHGPEDQEGHQEEEGRRHPPEPGRRRPLRHSLLAFAHDLS